MSVTAGLVAARLLHEAALLVFFGLAWFSFHVAPDLAETSPSFRSWRRRRLSAAALLALVGGLLWFALSAANMSGDVADATSPSALAALVTDTGFGKLWIARLAGCVLLLTLAIRDRARLVVAALAVPVVASLAGTGHADLPDGVLGVIHQGADIIHLMAAGLWIGALWALGWMVTRLPKAPQTAVALQRFSGVGQLAVGLLLLTGAVNAYGILGSPGKLVSTSYGRLLDIKLLAFLGMVGLAALNRFSLTPKLAGADAAVTRRLSRHILGEQVLALVVVMIVAIIGVLDPDA